MEQIVGLYGGLELKKNLSELNLRSGAFPQAAGSLAGYSDWCGLYLGSRNLGAEAWQQGR